MPLGRIHIMPSYVMQEAAVKARSVSGKSDTRVTMMRLMTDDR